MVTMLAKPVDVMPERGTVAEQNAQRRAQDEPRGERQTKVPFAPLTAVTRPCADTSERRERAASDEGMEKSMAAVEVGWRLEKLEETEGG